ncbi:sugar phosphate isomerase/epimerase [Flavobacterium franklandianum]|uniref:Sugar phosphate isomerase/epimerase n=1 Tax=Flavobacterium franklandianum TaxID=2594430 RepID=A0A553C8C1_9FLAO|nr:sugar phosphate isomerase/epimerase [Flavobacterium franklandianum]TRX16760.1 sugar phosphate isomerase/epimerase [Flavobacterium franklandianum]TRX29670.1 sugar phosphate isomerase/epimerase [Flavobacterium franklandianum]
MIKRRQFLISSGLALGTLVLAPSLAFASKKRSIGIQLYTLRDSLPKNVKGVLAQVGKAGFTGVETFGYSQTNGFFGTSAKDFQSILKDNGLKATSNHFDFNSYIKDGKTDILNSYIETAHILGSEYVTIPYVIQELRGKSIDDYKKLAAGINKVGEICHSNGLKLAYHNHDFEFIKFENTTGYEVLLNETDKNIVDFELDLYWVVRSGNDPLKLFKDHPGRFKMWHVKDMDKVNLDFNTEIGNGTIDFKSIFAQAKQSGMEHFFLEHESNYIPNPVESIKTSFDYINKNLI